MRSDALDERRAAARAEIRGSTTAVRQGTGAIDKAARAVRGRVVVVAAAVVAVVVAAPPLPDTAARPVSPSFR
jgi:hypothetical protein